MAAPHDNDCLRCIYCFDVADDPGTLLKRGCLCKGTMEIHVDCKAKFANTHQARPREWHFSHCEICSSAMTNEEGLLALARERIRLSELQCGVEEGSMEKATTQELLEYCLAFTFFATIIIKKCKNHDPSKDGGAKFCEEGISLLRSSVAKFQALSESSHKSAMIWALEMKIVDLLYFMNCLFFDSSRTLKDNMMIYFDGVDMAKNYNIMFKDLYVALLKMKKYFVDMGLGMGGSKRDDYGKLIFNKDENQIFQEIKNQILLCMEEAASSGSGAVAQGLAHLLNLQVEFVNFGRAR